MFIKIIVLWPRPLAICLLAHKSQLKYKCKLRRFQLSVVSSPGVANPGKVPIIPQRSNTGVSVITTLWGGGGVLSRSGTQKMILTVPSNGIQNTQGSNYLIFEKYFLKVGKKILCVITDEEQN